MQAGIAPERANFIAGNLGEQDYAPALQKNARRLGGRLARLEYSK